MIKAVIFDFGGVLTQGGKRGFITGIFADLLKMPVEKLDFFDVYDKLLHGKISDQTFFDEINHRYHANITKQQYITRAHDLFSPSEDVYSFAEDLRAKGLKTAILSNVFGMDAAELRKLGCYDGFDPVVLSYVEGLAKPEPEFYQVALNKLGLSAQEVLFIDDQATCLRAAQDMGIITLLGVEPNQIIADASKIIQAHNGEFAHA